MFFPIEVLDVNMQGMFPFNNSRSVVFNFNLSKALDILEEHSIKNQIFSPGVETIIIALYALIIATGLCSNLMVCTVVLSNTKVRSSRSAFVVNLNFSDILLCVFCMPFTLLVLIRRSWILGNVLCKLVPFVQASTIFVSAATVSAIAVDRCKVVLSFNPQRPRRVQREFLIYGLFIWGFSLLLSLPMCIYRGTVAVGLPGHHIYQKCIEQWPSATSKGIYTILTLVTQFVVPAIMLLITHIQVRYHLNNRTYRQRDEWTSSSNQESMTSEKLNRDLRRNTRATMVLLSISVVFTVSWLPWNTLNLLADFHPYFMSPKSLYLAFAICHMIAMTSSISNPILYGWLNSNIRREMVRLGWAVAKAGSALVSSKSSHTENLAVQPGNNTLMRSSANDSLTNRRDFSDCRV